MPETNNTPVEGQGLSTKMMGKADKKDSYLFTFFVLAHIFIIGVISIGIAFYLLVLKQ